MRPIVFGTGLKVFLNKFCGINLVVEYDLPKVETRVRFPYPAQKKVDHTFLKFKVPDVFYYDKIIQHYYLICMHF